MFISEETIINISVSVSVIHYATKGGLNMAHPQIQLENVSYCLPIWWDFSEVVVLQYCLTCS